MSSRQRILEAIAKVPASRRFPHGLKPYPAAPDQKHPGAAWPVLREVSRDGTMCGPYSRAYDVFAVLPAGYGPSSADAAEDLIVPLIEALEEIGEWTQPAELVEIAFDDASKVPGVRVRITPDPDDDDQ